MLTPVALSSIEQLSYFTSAGKPKNVPRRKYKKTLVWFMKYTGSFILLTQTVVGKTPLIIGVSNSHILCIQRRGDIVSPFLSSFSTYTTMRWEALSILSSLPFFGIWGIAWRSLIFLPPPSSFFLRTLGRACMGGQPRPHWRLRCGCIARPPHTPHTPQQPRMPN